MINGSIKDPIADRQTIDEIDIVKCRSIAEEILKEFRERKGVFSKFSFPQELIFPNGMERGSEEHLRYMTLTVSLSFIRDAEILHRMTYNAYTNAHTKWIFNPEDVIKRGQHQLTNTLIGLKDQRPNKDAEIWFRICGGLNDFQFKINNLLQSFNFDAIEISDFINANKKHFPYLAGNKILPLWLRIIDETAKIKLANMNKIPIPIDVHTARLSLRILYGKILEDKVSKEIRIKCQNGWKSVLNGVEMYPCQLDEPLWIMGKYNLYDQFIKMKNI